MPIKTNRNWNLNKHHLKHAHTYAYTFKTITLKKNPPHFEKNLKLPQLIRGNID